MFDVDNLNNIIKNSLKYPVFTKFLSLEEQKYLSNNKKIDIIFSNTYPNEERKRAIINSYSSEDIDFEISVLEFTYDKKFNNISHRDVLGALMSLGIKREVIGDIIISDRNFILCCSEFVNHIITNLEYIKRAKVELLKVNQDVLTEIEINNYYYDKIIVPSYRLDVIVSRVAKMNRNSASEIINEGLIKVNGVVITNKSYFCQIGDILSIRRVGRVILEQELSLTKKKKTVLLIKRTL